MILNILLPQLKPEKLRFQLNNNTIKTPSYILLGVAGDNIVEKTSFGDKFFAYLVTLGASVAWAVNLCYFLVWGQQIAAQIGEIIFFSVLLLLLFFYKRIFSLIAVGACVGAALFLAYLQITCGTVTQYLSIINNGSGLLQQSPGIIRGTLDGIALLCCIVVFFAAQNRIGLYILCLAGVITVFVLSIYNYGYSLPAFLIFLVCIGTLIIRRQTLHREKKFDINNLKHSGITALSLFFCILAILGSQLLFSIFSSVFANTPKVSLSEIYNKITAMLPHTASTGFSPYDTDNRLGQKVTYDDTLIFEVKASGPFYLKGRTYDNYTGTSWSINTKQGTYGELYNNTFNYAGLLYLSNRNLFNTINQTFISELPYYNQKDFLANEPKFSSALSFESLEVTVENKNVADYFAPLNFVGSSSVFSQFVKTNNGYPEMKLDTPLAAGSKISFLYPQLNLSSQQFKDMTKDLTTSYYKMLTLDTSQYMVINPIYQEANAAENEYLTPGPTVTERTRQLALQITKDCTNEFEKADAIKAWLDKNCKYTLDPKQPPRGQDFVDYFLFDSHEGYCQHFATAMTVLLREAGVPARYVEGYASPTPNSEGLYEVTNRQSHAWVEFYSNMFGFITADPTPSGSVPAALPPVKLTTSSAISPFQSSSGHHSSSSASAKASSGSIKANQKKIKVNYLSITAYIIIAVVAILILLYGGSKTLRDIRYRILKRYPKNKQAVMLYNYFFTALTRLGFDCAPSVTPFEFADGVRGKIDFGNADFDEITKIYVSARFGRNEISENDIAIMRRFYCDFLKYCHKYVGNAAFILKYPFL